MFTVIGHRGMGPTNRRYPHQKIPADVPAENTLLAFNIALAQNADGLEFDVYASQDNHVVICHDDILDRNVDGIHSCWEDENGQLGKISESTLMSLRTLPFGNGQTIPLLSEVLSTIQKYDCAYLKRTGKHLTINIELKGDDRVVELVHKVLLPHFEAKDLDPSNIIFNSYDPIKLQCMAKLNATSLRFLSVSLTNIHSSAELYATFLNARKSGMAAVDLSSTDIISKTVQFAKEFNLQLAAATNMMKLRAGRYSGKRYEKLSDLAIELLEAKRLFKFSQLYQLPIVFKADNPGKVIQFLSQLQATPKRLTECSDSCSLDPLTTDRTTGIPIHANPIKNKM